MEPLEIEKISHSTSNSYGASREVWYQGDKVLKIDRREPDGAWYGGCYSEILFWLKHKDMSLPITPILSFGQLDDGRWWVITPYADCGYLGPDDLGYLEDIGYDYGIDDIHDDNVGLLNGKPVIIDYAANEYAYLGSAEVIAAVAAV